MNTLLWVIIMTTIAGVGGTGCGGFIGAVIQRDSNKIVSLLLSFAGGVMMSVVCFDLIPEAFFPEGAVEPTPMIVVILSICLGYLIIYLLNYIIDKKTNPEILHVDTEHPHTADDLDELIHADHYNQHKSDGISNKFELFVAGVVMACAIALHNMPEGMVIGASYVGVDAGISLNSGFIIAIVIGMHNIPEGMSVSVPLISGGMNKWKAVGITALSGIPTIIGAILGYSVGLLDPIWLSLSLSFASGAMMYVVLGELLPEAFLMWKSKAPGAFAMIGIILGIILMQS